MAVMAARGRGVNRVALKEDEAGLMADGGRLRDVWLMASGALRLEIVMFAMPAKEGRVGALSQVGGDNRLHVLV